MTNTEAVSKTIFSQIGEGALAMLGAYGLLSTDTGVQFRIKGSKRCNSVKIDLAADDTYTVTFFKIVMPRFNSRTGEMSQLKVKKLSEHAGVYVSALHQLIERETGLYTRI